MFKWLFGKKGERFDFAEVSHFVNQLSMKDCRNFVESIVVEGGANKFDVEHGCLGEVNVLPESVKEFFSLYSMFRVVYGDLELSYDLVRKYSEFPGGVVVGNDSDFSQVIVINGSDALYVVDQGEQLMVDCVEAKSIWHFVLEKIFIIYPEFYYEINKGMKNG